MRNWKSTLFSILIALTLSCLGLGTSLWNVDSNVNPNTQKSFPLASNSNDKVAYFKDSKGATRSFTTIEGALNAAGKGNETDFANTIYVIPGTNPTINTDCTIASKDTLCIPYEGETYNGRQRNAEKGGTSNNSWKTPVQYTNGKISSGDYIANGSNPFADSNADYVAYFKKNEVTLNSKLIISSGAFLQIGGILGWKDIGVTGQTSGKYCQITRGKGASIENSGTIDCRGYIKETSKDVNSSIVSKNGSVIKAPLVFYDYQGGSYTASVYGGETKIFPLCQYDLPNVQSKLVFEFGSNLIGYVDLFTNDKEELDGAAKISARHNTDDLRLIGPKGEMSSDKKTSISHLFEMTDKTSMITWKRTNSGNAFSNYSEKGPECETKIEMAGKVEFNKTSISIQAAKDAKLFSGLMDWLLESIASNLNQTITTDSIDFPLPWNIKISVLSGGVFDLYNKLKVMPGGAIFIQNGAKANIYGKVIVYDNNRNTVLFSSPSKYYPSEKGNGRIINNGSLTIKAGASFGGKLTTESGDSSLIIEACANLSNIQSHEGSGQYSISKKKRKIEFQFIDYPNSPVTKTASGVCYRNYYRTDLAPNFVCENRNEQALVAGENYTSYPLTAGSSSFGWHDSKGSHDKYGIKFDYTSEDNETIDLKADPNSNVNYIENNGSDITLSAPVPEGNWTFDGFYYDKNYSLPLKEESNQYIIEQSKAIGYVNNNGVLLNNGILTIYSKWIKKGVKVDLEVKWYSADHTVHQEEPLKVETGSNVDVSSICSSHAVQRLNSTIVNYIRTEYALSHWILYKTDDSSKSNLLSSDNTFVPEVGYSYILEPVFDEFKFVHLTVENDSWVTNYGAWKTTYYIIYDFSITDNSNINLINSSEIFSTSGGGSNTSKTTIVNGWISINAIVSLKITSRSNKGPNSIRVFIDGSEKKTYSGNNYGSDIKQTIVLKELINNYQNGNIKLAASHN